jgi:hypothetical protein
MDNNGWKLNIEAEKVYQEHRDKIEEQNTAQFIAGQGYLPKEEDGKIVAPASLVGDITEFAHELSGMALAGITDPTELATYLATSYVTQTLTEALNGLEINDKLKQVEENIAKVSDQIEKIEGPESNWKPIYRGTTQTD